MSTNRQGVLQGLDDCGTIGNVGRPGGSNSSGLTRDRGKGEKNQAMKKYYSTSTSMWSASLLRRVNVPPMTRRATGSFRGARCLMVMVVPGTSPISRMRRPSSPLTLTAVIVPLWLMCMERRLIRAIVLSTKRGERCQGAFLAGRRCPKSACPVGRVISYSQAPRKSIFFQPGFIRRDVL